MRMDIMPRGDVLKDLVLQEKDIFKTPHVVQELRRNDLHWSEFLRLYIDDLAFGANSKEWIERLLEEGNINLATELINFAGMGSEYKKEIEEKAQSWSEMYDYAISVAEKYLEEQSSQINGNEKTQFLEMLEFSKGFAQEKSYGEAYNTADKAHEMLKQFVEKRRRLLEESYRYSAEKLLSIGMKVMETDVDRISGGIEMFERVKKLHPIANVALINRDFALTKKITNWMECMLANQDVPLVEVDQIISEILPSANPIFDNLSESTPELESVPSGFEREWSYEDDDYLIDNYDVLTNEQLKSRFVSTISEIELRLNHLGLPIDRSKRVKLPIRNPYVAGMPIKGDKVFVGREDVFEFIRETLGYSEENQDRNLCALFGHRRTGKTSLLLQLKGKKRELLAPQIPVYVDLEGMLPRSSKTALPIQVFFWKVAVTIAEELSDAGIDFPMPQQNEFEDADWSFKEFLRRAVKETGGKGIVVLFDEFQAIEPRQGILNVDIYHMLRHIIQHSKGVSFILSGTMEIERLMREYKAAMFGAALTKRIDFLDERDARKLIISPVKNYITYTQEAEDVIVQLTACHPYFVQLVCYTLTNYLIERGKQKVFAHDVDRVIPLVLERGIHFDEIWSTDMQDMEKYLMAIAGEMLYGKDAWCSLEQIEKRLRNEGIMPKDETRVIEAIEKLSARRILKTSDDGKDVRFYVRVFGKWVSSNKPLAIVRRDVQSESAKLNRRIERETISS